jgi:hypothetical protein
MARRHTRRAAGRPGSGDRGPWGRGPGYGWAALALSVLLADPLLPAVITVQGGCALAEAIRAANTDAPNGGCPAGSAADTIVLTADVALLAVEEVDDGDNGLPTVTSEITIEGNSHTIERSGSAVSDFRILKVGSAGDLTLENTTVSGGRATGGSHPGNVGGAFYNLGSLTLDHSALVSNLSGDDGGAVFGALGSLYSFDSTFAANAARRIGNQSLGGAVALASGSFWAERSVFENNFVGAIGAFPQTGFGGAVYVGLDASATIIDSTFTGNNVLASFSADGWVIFSLGPVTLKNTTVSLNGTISTPLPGAALNLSSDAVLTHVTLAGNRSYALDGDLDATATLIADTDGANCTGSTTITGTNNIADDASCSGVPDSLTGLDPVLADNGGPTPTHALQAGSNAIDAAGFCALGTDQRGAPRVGACDSGAFEFMGCPVLILSDDTVADEQTFEECAITAGPNFTVIGPGGDLTLLFGASARLADGFSVEADGQLTVEHDPALLLVLDELVEADRARRRRLGRLVGEHPAVDQGGAGEPRSLP